MTRSDYTWLTLRAGLRDLVLQEHLRTYNFFNGFLYPEEQCPQMITMIGERTKTLIMRKLRFGPRAPDGIAGEVHLRVDIDGLRVESPRIFADCELHNSSSLIKVGIEQSDGDTTRRPLTWHRGISHALDQATLSQIIYSKLIAPFSTVICFFAADLGGLPAVAELLALWLIGFSNRPSDLPLSTFPRILILTEWDRPEIFDEEKATNDFILALGREAEKKHGVLTSSSGKLKMAEIKSILLAQFGKLRVISYPSLNSSYRSWKSLRSRILLDSDELQSRRKEACVAFSSNHFKAFFSLACDHFCSNIVSPFNFIQASRIVYPVPTELSFYIGQFLKKVAPVQYLNFAVPIIASALVFDSYPVGMHGFQPYEVYKQLHHQMCLSLDVGQQRGTSSQIQNAIEVTFCQYASEIINAKTDGTQRHEKVLSRFKELWKGIYSNKICFPCMARPAENTLTCNHVFCTPCIMEHGKANEAEPSTFWVAHCPLCCEPNNINFNFKPPTAGVRAIIAEGGGVRAVVPLTFLKELENCIDLPMSISDHFDIGVGCSSGSIIILGLFCNKWTVGHCLTQFQDQSNLAFGRKGLFSLLMTCGIPRRLLEVFLSIATDSRYSSAGITKALKSAFGNDTSLFKSGSGGAKVAVVATTTNDSSTCIFTNYNGQEERSVKCGYKLVRPDDPSQELLTWQTARASSAAPPYFKSFQGYQDGGLGGHNNPINLALWEQDNIWGRNKKDPDVVLSLGTGFKRTSDLEEKTPDKLRLWSTRCIPRLFRSFLNFFVGETRWQELQNNLEPHIRQRFHRLNVEFSEDEPELDDLQSMSALQRQTQNQSRSTSEVQNCADNLLAALFYLKLVGKPVFEQNLFTCKAHILCRLGPSHPAFLPLTRRLWDSQAYFFLDFRQKIDCVDENARKGIEYGGPFSRFIELKVRSLEDFVDIKIGGIIQRDRSISNCPYKVKTWIEDQDLHSEFGSRTGNKRPLTHSNQISKRVRFRY